MKKKRERTEASDDETPKGKREKSSGKEEVTENNKVSEDVVKPLIEFKELPKDIEGFKKRFSSIADSLLNEFELVIKGKAYRIVEIEFYWKDEEIHNDPFTHGDADQKQCAMWYFHKAGGKSYKGGTYKGLDIAFGNGSAYGGILLRALEDPTGKIIEGPCMCVDHILAVTKSHDIAKLVASGATSVEERPDSPLWLRRASSDRRHVWQSPRVGLTLKKKDQPERRKQYLMLPYRYFTVPNLKKGRHYIVAQMFHDGKTQEEIVKLTKAPKDTVKRFVTEVEKGREGSRPADEFFGLALKNEGICELFGVLSQSFSE